MVSELGLPQFTGLYLPDSSSETPSGSLAYLNNMDVTNAGGVVQRHGTSLSTVNHSSVAYAFVHQQATPQYIVLNSSGDYQIYTAGSTSLTAGTGTSGGQAAPAGSCQMLRDLTTATAPDTYVCSKTAVLKRWDGSAWTAISNSPKCGAVCQAGFSDRMVATAFTASTTNGPNSQPVTGSTVYVSNPAAPQTWTTGDYTELTPGDGEDIIDAVMFNSQTIVFKNSSFFVMYDETGSGGAVDLLFHERSGVGLATKGAFAKSPVGVFFLAKDGIYLTDGGPAVRVSGDIDGFFTGNLPSWTIYSRFLPAPDTAMKKFEVIGDRLYAALDNVSSGGARCNTMLVYNWSTRKWIGYYDHEVAGLASIKWTDMPRPLLIGVGWNATNYRAETFYPTLRTDNTAFMPAGFQTQWIRPEEGEGNVGLDKVMVLRLDVWGKGIGTAGVCVDYQSTPGPTQVLNFGDMATGDVWDGTGTDVWGDGSDPTDVWSGGFSSTTDLLRLFPPARKFLNNLNGRGNYLSIRFSKSSTSTFFFMERPRMTLLGRGSK